MMRNKLWLLSRTNNSLGKVLHFDWEQSRSRAGHVAANLAFREKCKVTHIHIHTFTASPSLSVNVLLFLLLLRLYVVYRVSHANRPDFVSLRFRLVAFRCLNINGFCGMYICMRPRSVSALAAVVYLRAQHFWPKIKQKVMRQCDPSAVG